MVVRAHDLRGNFMRPILSHILGWRRYYRLRQRPLFFSTLHCPHCGMRNRDQMPGNASVRFYECARCHLVLKPKAGHCCVYCSYGTVPCPPQQRSKWGRERTLTH